MLKTDKVYVIRHKVLIEGLSQREAARQLGVGKKTVAKYLKISSPKRVESNPRPKPVTTKTAGRIDELLLEWRPRTTAKQRITAARLHPQLREEGYAAGITTVKDYFREKRRQSAEVYIPLLYQPGEVAQADFFEVVVEKAGRQKKVWKFLLRLMYSGYDFVWLYEKCDQVSFLDAHVLMRMCGRFP
jgi:transposase